MEKMYCFNCDKEVNVKTKEVVSDYHYRNQNFQVKETKCFCAVCNEELIDELLDENLKKVYNGYLNIYNLSISSFKYIRNSLGLSQELFAKALGWGKRSIIRYENGEEIPSLEYLKTYIKLNESSDYILECLNLNRKNLDDTDYYKILKKINLNIDIKSRNVIYYLLEDNPMFLMSLLKNLFACDFLSYKERLEPLTSFKYIKLQYGPVVDNYQSMINDMVRTGELALSEAYVLNGDIKYKHKTINKCDYALFNDEELKIMSKVKEFLKGKSAIDLSNWSHKFKGWIDTPLCALIDYKKYAKDFELK